jgi:RNA 2',3'-cyclic 3'-phosphodiesterase
MIPTERLFFALWPTDTVRQSLQTLSQLAIQNATGKVMPVENLHITLLFIGEVDLTTKRGMQQAAATVQGRRFTLCLDTLEYWKRNQVLWFGAHQVPPPLQRLVTDLTTKLQPYGYRPETRPYQAHITLMRKAMLTNNLPVISPVTWAVEEFCLVRSKLEARGAQYQVLERWLLN